MLTWLFPGNRFQNRGLLRLNEPVANQLEERGEKGGYHFRRLDELDADGQVLAVRPESVGGVRAMMNAETCLGTN